MTELMFWTRVNMDGTGDFVHAIELFKAVKEHAELSKYNLTLIIVIGRDSHDRLNPVWEKHYKRFEEQIGTLNLSADRCYFGIYDKVGADLRSPTFRARCLLAKQHIVVSCPTQLLLKQPIAADATIKYICEHESGAFEPLLQDKIVFRNMGLAPKRYGIKVPLIPSLSPEEALSPLPKEDPYFWEIISTQTKSASPTALLENNLLFTAYLSEPLGFTRFLLLVTSNQSLPKDKDIIIYFSSAKDGASLTKEIKEESLPDASAMECIKQVELIEKSDDNIRTDIINVNPRGRVLRIFCNFRVNDAAFNALYRASTLVGVSGDTSFERAVGFQILPFYFSYNYSLKKETLLALQRIVRNVDLGIPESIQQDFITYFKYEEKWYKPVKMLPERIEELKHLNLTGMCAEWYKVARYLREHFNIYTFLPQLIEEELTTQKALNNEARNPQVFALNASSQTDSPLVQNSMFPAATDTPPALPKGLTIRYSFTPF